ncbi:MAG: hypothetical protein LQ352_007865 [Teloschistes flavicans]|nr:MAG: hypothetical protein LQ352_007865 [Teloschistes flavicans]
MPILSSLERHLTSSDTDIKISTNYIIDKTTHVVQSKRNTAKGLHALINGRYIVTESFIDALIYATVPTDLDHDESLSPLEEDFDKNWPDAMQHVPPRGREPNERPVEIFAPNPERANVFDGYSFVFCEKSQFESLQPPITNGGGKAFLFKLQPRQTTTEELVGYVKNVAGEQGLGELEDGSEGKGVVVVKFRGGKDDFDWAAELGKEASLALDLRFIEQNEFMDAILMNDASVLRRPLEAADDDDYPDSTSRGAMQNGKMAVPKEPEPKEYRPPPPTRRQRGLVKSRFKGFSDDDDDDVKPSISSIPAEETRGQPELSQHQTQLAQADDRASEFPSSRKRPAPEPDDEEEFIDQLLPAAAAMKRRRLEEARLRGDSPSTAFNKEPSPPTQPPPKKATSSELDVQKSLRDRRAAADQAAARASETFHEGLETADIEAMRDLAVVEEFEIPPRRSSLNGATTHPNHRNGAERWNPAWNGRKNFKKFRRQGDGGAAGATTANVARRGAQGVIVPLEEVKKSKFGIGQDYWLESGGGGSGSLKRKREKASQMVEGESQIDESVDAGTAVKNTAVGRKKVPKELQVAMETSEGEEMGDVVDVEAPRRTRGMMMLGSQQTQTQTQTQKSTVGSGGGGANARGRVATAGATARKQGRLYEAKKRDVGGSDESEEDELKFRFGKRRRLQQ